MILFVLKTPFISYCNQDPVPDNICEYMYKNNVTFDVQIASTDGGSSGVYTLGWEDVTFSDKMYFYEYRESESGCILSHQADWPKTVFILGLPFYNKHLIKHDYDGDGQLCVTDKPEGYEKLWQSPAPPNFYTTSAATKASFKVLSAVAALAVTAAWM